MGKFLDTCDSLSVARIGFSVHYVGVNDAEFSCVITVSEAVNNDQLSVLTDLGAHMTPDRNFAILTRR